MGEYLSGISRRILFVALLALPVAAYSQQSNLQVLVPPSLDLSSARTRDFALGYSSVGGARVNAGCLDVTLTFAARVSSSVYSGGNLGTALVGGLGPDRLYLGQTKKDISGVTMHATAFRYRMYGGGDSPRRMLIASVPLSFGSFTIGNNNKEETTVYNLLAGLQGGGALNYRPGRFMLTPAVLGAVMGGYKERYNGGVYYSNLNSGWVKPFFVTTVSADLLYMPKNLRLSAAWQHTFSSGEDRATDAAMVQLAFGWETWGRKKAKPDAKD